MIDYNRMGTDQLKGLLRAKIKARSSLEANIYLRTPYGRLRELSEQITSISAIIFARENTLKLWED